LLLDNIRQTDRLGCWGGDEFLFLQPDTDATGAIFFAEKICRKIAGHQFTGPVHITASLGVVVYQGYGTVKSLIARADDATFAAKKTNFTLPFSCIVREPL
jgi:diguanylate cyclase (GGDEF)-like protein